MRLFRFVISTFTGLIFLMEGQTWAHSRLLSAIPSIDGEVVELPTEISLEFSTRIEADSVVLKLQGPGNADVELGSVYLENRGRSYYIKAPVRAKANNGVYTIYWTVVDADDGHTSQGSFNFILER